VEVNGHHHRVVVTERSQVSAARQTARELARQGGLSEEDEYRAGIVATELGTNLVKHAHGGGELLLRLGGDSGAPALECYSIDRGPGMISVARSLVDGHSTSGSAGSGLGAVKRLSSLFDVYSAPDLGTVIFSQVAAVRSTVDRKGFAIAAIAVPKDGESVCGDAWAVRTTNDYLRVLVADGLGHGQGAHDAAQSATALFADRVDASCSATLERMHNGLRHTRGVAASIAEVRKGTGRCGFAGVGNVSAAVWTATTHRQAVTGNGTLGLQVRRFEDYSYPWSAETLLVMHTDGLGSHWSLTKYPGIYARHPAIAAALLYRDFSRQRDDVTVFIAREAA
jgi:anti-sigma regulatory factor (Ser/Thr protein kinase)